MTNENKPEVRRLQEALVWLARRPDRDARLANAPADEIEALTRSWAFSIPAHYVSTLSDALTAVDEAVEASDGIAAARPLGIGQREEGGCRDA